MILQAHARPADTQRGRDRNAPMACQVQGCPVRPKEGKDHCAEHIDRRPYVRALMLELERREGEAASARGGTWRDVDPRGPLARWVLSQADKTGGASVERIAKDTGLAVDVVTRCAAALVRARLATSRLGGRKGKGRSKKKRFLVPAAGPVEAAA